MNAYELEEELKRILGVSTDARYDEWWEYYTGPNALYHTLANVAYEVNPKTNVELVKKDDNTVTVPGLGDFTKVETYEDNWDSYEGTCETYLVFEFQDKHYRVFGYLDSHHGGVFDGNLEEVKQVEKTIKVWERA